MLEPLAQGLLERMEAPPGLPLDLSFSTRMKRGLGVCRPHQARIRINHALRRPELRDILCEVLCHELAHYLTYLDHGVLVRPHGPEWRARMASGGFEPRVRIPLSEILAAKQGGA